MKGTVSRGSRISLVVERLILATASVCRGLSDKVKISVTCGLTYESPLAVAFFCLHLLVDEPECVLQGLSGRQYIWADHATHDMAREVAKTALVFERGAYRKH